MPAQQRVRLDDQDGLLPRPHAAGQQDQEGAISIGQVRPFDLSVKDNELLTEQGVFRDELRLRADKIVQTPAYKRGGRWLRPEGELFPEQVHASGDHLPDPIHQVREHRQPLSGYERDGGPQLDSGSSRHLIVLAPELEISVHKVMRAESSQA